MWVCWRFGAVQLAKMIESIRTRHSTNLTNSLERAAKIYPKSKSNFIAKKMCKIWQMQGSIQIRHIKKIGTIHIKYVKYLPVYKSSSDQAFW